MITEDYINTGTYENKEKNEKLIEKYPFLKPPKEYVDFYIDENADYEYSFTMADFFFDGYLDAFGFDLLETNY